MIHYSTSGLALSLLFKVEGSVFPKALVWGLPNAVMTFFIHRYLREYLGDLDGFEGMWSGFTVLLGFLIVFRNGQAYSRFWEGATLIQQMQGEWINAISSVIAFCSQAEERKKEVLEFQHLLVRLMSMLHCQALQKVCHLHDDSFEILDLRGFDVDSLDFLSHVDDRCEVLLQWLQRVIMDASNSGTVNVAPPILSRAFQELSRGMVNLNNVRKIREVPFPFPYAQMIQVMLIVHSLVMPFLASYLLDNVWFAMLICLFVTTSQWSLLYIPLELDHPFGEDKNDFDMNQMQHTINRALLTLLHPQAQLSPSCFDKKLSLVPSSFHMSASGARKTTIGMRSGQTSRTQSLVARAVLRSHNETMAKGAAAKVDAVAVGAPSKARTLSMDSIAESHESEVCCAVCASSSETSLRTSCHSEPSLRANLPQQPVLVPRVKKAKSTIRESLASRFRLRQESSTSDPTEFRQSSASRHLMSQRWQRCRSMDQDDDSCGLTLSLSCPPPEIWPSGFAGSEEVSTIIAV